MTVHPSLYDLHERLFRLAQQIDEVHKKLSVYHIALTEVSQLSADKKAEPLEVLVWDLHRHSVSLSKFKKNLHELMALDLPSMFIKRAHNIHLKLENLEQIYQALAMQTKKIQE